MNICYPIASEFMLQFKTTSFVVARCVTVSLRASNNASRNDRRYARTTELYELWRIDVVNQRHLLIHDQRCQSFTAIGEAQCGCEKQ